MADETPVPHAAWLAADKAYELEGLPLWEDELHHALVAASPHIRIAELDDLLRALAVRAAQIPLLGRRNNAQRQVLEDIIQLLTERKSALEERSP